MFLKKECEGLIPMNKNFTKNGYCNCGNPEYWIKDSSVPIKFDKKMNEYYIPHGTEMKSLLVMYYCFFCGGKLPDSKRGSFFTNPSRKEVKEMLSIVKNITDEKEMERLLGEPDLIHRWNKNDEDLFKIYKSRRFKKQFTYSKKWKSLVLILSLSKNGKFEVNYSGQEKRAV